MMKWKIWNKNYNVDIWPWIFHHEHGWQFVFDGSTPEVIFLWDLGWEEWIFLNLNTYRWKFLFGQKLWLDLDICQQCSGQPVLSENRRRFHLQRASRLVILSRMC